VKRIKFIGKLFVLFLALFIGSTLIRSSTNVAHAKTYSSKIAKAINEDLGDSDSGSTTFKWVKADGYFEATLDSNSNIYSSMDEGNVSIWNAYVRSVKAESKYMYKHGMKKYSAFEVLNPNDDTKMFLEVDKGKVQYNIGEDLQ